MQNVREDKKRIRESIRLRLAELRDDQREACAASVFAKIEALEAFSRARTVALYHALPDEVPTAGAIRRWSEGNFEGASGAAKQIVLPCVEGDDMVFRAVCGETRRGCFGIEEPLGEEVDPVQIDIMIVPGVAFDASGHRLGRGKGYYDRFLGRCDLTGCETERENLEVDAAEGGENERRGAEEGNTGRRNVYKIGVCFPFQLVENIPREPHDHPVDVVITCDL